MSDKLLNMDLELKAAKDENRKVALAQLNTLHFPTNKDEEWRFISLKSLSKHSYSEVEANATEQDLAVFGEVEGIRLVLVNGKFSEELSLLNDTDAFEIEILESPELSHQAFDDDFFAALNRTSATSNIRIRLDKNTKAEKPVLLYHLQVGDALNYGAPRVGVEIDAFSEATIVEHFAGLSNSHVYYNNPFTAFELGTNAQVKHYRVQRESKSAFHIGRVQAHVAEQANYSSYSFNFGAKLSRNDIRTIQQGLESHFAIDALTMISGEQVSDTHSVMDHKFAHGTSHQLHKVLVDDKAHSVFNGKIFVRQDAQKIDSFQENRNILLSEQAKVNTKPQLEIFADDVRCSHGATIGQLDGEELFYLRSRGLTKSQAKLLITKGFALEVIEEVEIESLRELLAADVDKYVMPE